MYIPGNYLIFINLKLFKLSQEKLLKKTHSTFCYSPNTDLIHNSPIDQTQIKKTQLLETFYTTSGVKG